MVSSVRALWISVASAAAALSSAANYNDIAFVANAQGRTLLPSPSKRGRIRCSAAARSSQTSLFHSQNDLFVLSVDGTLASSCRTRAWMAVCVAMKVWPELSSNMEALGINPTCFAPERNTQGNEESDSYEWLLQKLSALSSITQQGDGPDAMLGCDAVLLARLLLEEQMLDGGRSNGRGGKYGGKFHPSLGAEGGSSSKVGSRPLTVGEIYANWHELRDVTRMKYPAIEVSAEGKTKRQDPLPEIRQCLKELYSMVGQKGVKSKILPTMQSLTYDVLFDYGESLALRHGTMLLLGHEAQIPLALESLSLLGCGLEVSSDVDFPFFEDEMKSTLCVKSSDASNGLTINVQVTTADKVQGWLKDSKDDENPPLLLVVPNAQTEETHSSMIEQIVTTLDTDGETNCSRNVYVMHSSLEVLKHCKLFLGEDAPKLNQGLRTCILPHAKTAVTMLLPEWSDNVHPTAEQNDGEMDPWLNLVSEEQFLELISARITAPVA